MNQNKVKKFLSIFGGKLFHCFLLIFILTGCESPPNRNYSIAFNNWAGRDAKNNKQKETWYNEAVRWDPNFAIPRKNRGLFYWDQERYPEAYEDFFKVYQLEPAQQVTFADGVCSVANAAAMSGILCASKLVNEKKLIESETWLNKVVALDTSPLKHPLYQRLYYKIVLRLGEEYVKLGNQLKAEEYIDKWLEYDPRYKIYKKEMGTLLFNQEARIVKQKEEEQAGKENEKQNNMLIAFEHYAKAYSLVLVRPENEEEEKQKERQKEKQLTEDLIRTWKKCSPQPKISEEVRRYLIQAEEHVRTHKDLEAGRAYLKAYKISPWYPQSSFNYALILGKLGETALVDNNAATAKKYFSDAIAWMKNYLKIVPQAENARAAQDKIYRWEAAGGKG